MNLQYIRYALEVARTGSISKAAENLSVAQPNLSRAVKELESSLGITIFARTRTGMTVTPAGEKLLSAGGRILRDVDELETMFDGETAPREALTITVAGAAYLSDAFARFCRELPTDGRYELTYREVGATEAIGTVARGESRLGVVRYPRRFEAYYNDLLAERELCGEVVAELASVILCGASGRLSDVSASPDSNTTACPEGLCELLSSDLPDELLSLDGTSVASRRLTVSDRTARYELLRTDPTTFERTLPLPTAVLGQNGLITRPMASPVTVYRDVLIYQKSYQLTPLDRRLLACLRDTAKGLPVKNV